MKYLLLASLLTACNFGLVDVKDKPKTCYEIDHDFDLSRDTVFVDSVAFDCGGKEVTTPFDHLLDPVLMVQGDTVLERYPDKKPSSP